MRHAGNTMRIGQVKVTVIAIAATALGALALVQVASGGSNQPVKPTLGFELSAKEKQEPSQLRVSVGCNLAPCKVTISGGPVSKKISGLKIKRQKFTLESADPGTIRTCPKGEKRPNCISYRFGVAQNLIRGGKPRIRMGLKVKVTDSADLVKKGNKARANLTVNIRGTG